jgi:hypothetical protein
MEQQPQESRRFLALYLVESDSFEFGRGFVRSETDVDRRAERAEE